MAYCGLMFAQINLSDHQSSTGSSALRNVIRSGVQAALDNRLRNTSAPRQAHSRQSDSGESCTLLAFFSLNDLVRMVGTASRLLRYENQAQRVEVENATIMALAKKRQMVG
jgi:hypothetical protein